MKHVASLAIALCVTVALYAVDPVVRQAAASPTITINGISCTLGGSCTPPVSFGFGSYTAPVAVNWSSIGSGGVSTVTGVQGGVALLVTGVTGGTGTNGTMGGISATVAGTAWTVNFVLYAQRLVNSNGTGTYMGAGFTDGTKWEGVTVGQDIGTTGLQCGNLATTNYSAGTLSAANGTAVAASSLLGPIFIRLTRATNTYTGFCSIDGTNYYTSFTDVTPFLTSTGVAVIGTARGGTNAPTFLLESFQ